MDFSVCTPLKTTWGEIGDAKIVDTEDSGGTSRDRRELEMNIVKRLLHTKNTFSVDESSMIPSGQLYLVRSPSSPKSENECLCNDAILTIRDTSHRFNHELVIWKGNESDANSLSDDDDEDHGGTGNFFENESNILKSFSIDASLKICLFERYNEKIISWNDMEGDIGDMFEYKITRTVAEDTIEKFMTSIYKCKYERKYRRPSSNISLLQLEEFALDRSDILGSALDPSIRSNSSILNMKR